MYKPNASLLHGRLLSLEELPRRRLIKIGMKISHGAAAARWFEGRGSSNEGA